VLSQPIPNIHVIGIYRSKTKVTISQLIVALTHLPDSAWGFNIDLMQVNSARKALKKISYNRQRIHSVG